MKVVAKPGTDPFPCQNCHCGCSTPEQCWTNCCCFSPEERLQWARDRNVKPPEYAVLSNHSDSSVSKVTVATKSCCSQKSACCDNSASQVAKVEKLSCCSNKPDCDEPGNCLDANEASTVVVLSMDAIKCQGGSFDYCHLPIAIVESNTIDFTLPEPPFAPFLVHDEWLPSAAHRPPMPPPRASFHDAIA